MDNAPRLTCLLADAHSADAYCSEALDAADRQRLLRTPALAQRTDWRVSRFLKQQQTATCLSLSHSHGVAALVCGAAQAVGVDVEYMRQRDFRALAAWVCSASECAFLAQNGWQATDFYPLWTLKEALIKAAGLSFPGDMAHVGVNTREGRPRLQVCGRDGWYGLHARVGTHWMLACVWQNAAIHTPHWQCYGALTTPHILCHYR